MGQPKKDNIRGEQLQGLRNLGAMRTLLQSLHQVGCARDKAGNRQLHMSDYCLLVLAWLYNPIIDSLRGLQQASALSQVQKRLGVGRASLGSLSESVRVFDPDALAELAAELSAKLPERSPERFAAVQKRPTAVDGSVFKLLVQIGKLAWLPRSGGGATCGYRMHAQFEIFRSTTHRIDVTGANPRKEADERAVLARTLEAGRCYLLDRGFQKYSLWDAIHEAKSEYVCRLHDNTPYQVVQERALTAEDQAAGVLSDQLVQFGTPNSRTPPPQHPTRLVIVQAKPHNSRRSKNGVSGPNCDGFLRLVTDNLELPAQIVAELYRLRWTIELYFRMIKQLLGCRHLLSTHPEGVTIQLYMAIIACIMILALTGKMPTKRTYEMICHYLAEWASLEELEAHIQKLQ